MKSLILGAACALTLGGASLAAQQGSAPLQLPELLRLALARDARGKEVDLLTEQADLRTHNIEVERLPSFSVLGQTQYQSDVPTPPPFLPGGQPLFAPPKDTYDISVRVDQRIYDASTSARLAVTRAETADSQARVRTTLYALRTDVTDAFFAAALLQEQLNALAATLDDLEARLRETSARVREGTALAGESAAIEATLLQQQQRRDELRASRASALARLSLLTGQTLASDAAVSMPELGDAVTSARSGLDGLRARPEYAQFDRARDRASRQQDLAAALDKPQVLAYGRGGFGKPGLNIINDQPEWYGLGGVQLQWKAWTWGSSGREREALALQQSIVSAEEAAFTDSLHRAIQPDLAAIDRLQAALSSDDRIVSLREGIQTASRARLREGVITASDYVDRETETLNATFDRARHRVELAQARARVLTTLGLEVR
jgi:outer membrane protein TolC